MSDFHAFADRIRRRFDLLSKNELFVVGDDNRIFEQHYLASFPPGTNPVYKTNTEHDCSCCKNFIRNLGNVVAIIDGKIETVWDVKGAPAPYDTVAAAMDVFVKTQPITDVFRTTEHSFGAEQTKQLLEGGEVKRWNHFYGRVDARHRLPAERIGPIVGERRTTTEVLIRGLEELNPGAFETVLSLIESKALYRGEEHLRSIKEFQKLQKSYEALSSARDKNAFAWANAMSPAARFRNTVIGTLLTDISDGVDLEAAVRSFETKVAPTNYKRPTALITPRMVDDAVAKLKELGLEHAVERRFAKISDVNVNNVLWVDNSVKGQMQGLKGLLMPATATKAPKKVVAQEVGIGEFMTSVLPTASSIEILVGNNHLNNLMSLTAPVHADTGGLFKWNNDFAWAYAGNITDSIKEKVKKAGGNVTNAKMRISLAWFNFDDLDIHIYEPNGNRIYFGNKGNKLDVDMNAGGGRTREPVENVSWVKVPDGEYRVQVNQFSQRERTDVGCVVEIENDGNLTQLSYKKPLQGTVDIATVVVRDEKIVDIKPAEDTVGGGISMEKWGVKTETFVKVNTLMFSPNYWDDNAVGNKHWFFVLDGCKNDEPTRGIFNEFLRSDLEQHRKVFEVLGDKTKCPPTDDQLSGLGFSSTRSDTVCIRVTEGTRQKTFNVSF